MDGLDEWVAKIKLQNAEFTALQVLKKADDSLCQVAVVDDDYPAVRHRYEGALRAFLAACKANGRSM